jgi:CRAL/TRIO domain
LEFVNAPGYINVMLNIFRSFMTQKMRTRISVTGGKPASTVENAILPPELGGKGPSYAELAKHWKQVVQDNVEWFRKDGEFKVIDD